MASKDVRRNLTIGAAALGAVVLLAIAKAVDVEYRAVVLSAFGALMVVVLIASSLSQTKRDIDGDDE